MPVRKIATTNLSHMGRTSQQMPLNWQVTCHDLLKEGKKLSTGDEYKAIQVMV